MQITAQNSIDDNELIIKNRFNQLCTKLNAQGTIILNKQIAIIDRIKWRESNESIKNR